MINLSTNELESYKSPDRIIQYKVEIKGLQGNFWTDVSDRLIDKIGLRKEQEHQGSPSTNTFNFKLRNDDGYFSPNNSNSPYYGNLMENLEVMIFTKTYNRNTGQWYETRRFTGYTEKFKPNARRQECTVTGKDFMKDFMGEENKFGKNEILIDIGVTDAIREIHYRVRGAETATQKSAVDAKLKLDYIDKTIGFLDLRDVEPASLFAEINLATAGVMFYDEYGYFVYKSNLGGESYDYVDSISVDRLSDLTVDTGQIECNDVTVNSDNKKIQERQMVFHWTETDEKTVEGNESDNITGVLIPQEGYPSEPNERWFCEFNADIVVDIDNYDEVVLENELGNPTSEVSIDPDVWRVEPGRARVRLQNNKSSGGAWLGKFQIWGKPVVSQDTISATYALGEHEIKVRKRKEINCDIITSKEWAMELAQYMVYRGKDVKQTVKLDFKSDPRYQVRDIITVYENNTGLNHDFEIIRIDEVLGVDYQLNMELRMLPKGDFNFDYDGGEKDTNTDSGDGEKGILPAVPGLDLMLLAANRNGENKVRIFWDLFAEREVNNYEIYKVEEEVLIDKVKEEYGDDWVLNDLTVEEKRELIFENSKNIQILNGQTDTFIDSSVTYDKKYYYYVLAKDENDNRSIRDNTIIKDIVVNVNRISAPEWDTIIWGADSIEITWHPHPDENFDEYEIRLDDDFGENI
ncbi:MAG: hypothetical protein ACOCQD_04010 [archaeon]